MIYVYALKTLLGLLIVPFFLAQYTTKAGVLTGSGAARWGYKNIYLYLLVVFAAGAIIFEIAAYPDAPKRNDVALEFFSATAYSADLDQHKTTDPGWQQTKTLLLRKFEQAEFAWHHQDYKETVNIFVTIKAGKDAHGSFAVIPSYVIANNLGCASFKVQRNKAFVSGFYFQEARTLVTNGTPEANRIDQNLLLLDQMVNTLD